MENKKYEVAIYGKITRFEAGVIYRAFKEDNIKVMAETITTLYDEANKTFGYYTESYNQDRLYFDRIYNITQLILDEEFEKAQKELNYWEDSNIESAGKKSIYYNKKRI